MVFCKTGDTFNPSSVLGMAGCFGRKVVRADVILGLLPVLLRMHRAGRIWCHLGLKFRKLTVFGIYWMMWI
jgi:hypothetical protein